MSPSPRLLLALASLATTLSGVGAVAPVPLKVRAASASSVHADHGAGRAIDGIVSAESRWTSAQTDGPSWIELDLGGMHTVAGVHVFSGIDPATTLRSLSVQFWRDGAWQDIPSALVVDNRSMALAIAFDDTVAVRAERLRLWITATPDGHARVQEVVVWPAGCGAIPAAVIPAAKEHAPVPLLTPILLNQSGFNLGKPKRFTAPTLPEGTPFIVRRASGGPPLFAGTLRGHAGDFSAFDPDSEDEFVVEAGSLVSVPFRVGRWWLERVTYQNAINFMIDSRHYVGNWRKPCRGSYGWRDDHHFGWELHTLVSQYLSNPSAYERMPRQVSYEAPADPALWGALQPCREDAPDLVKLIHWGADIIVTQSLTHEHLKAQLAYFLYAWPWLKTWLPEQNYEAVSNYAFAHWSESRCDRTYPYDESPEHDLLALKTGVGTTKGCYPPGFSIEPNLLMYEVARREGRAEAEGFFDAAFRQTEWLIAHLDWNNPQATKGQRMSEFLTLTGLTHFLRAHPRRAPAGLQEKIEAWAQDVIRRSENLWDFRRLDDGDGWTPMGEKPTMWNEPGNVAGLPGVLAAARPFVRDPGVRERLDQLVWSHLDNMFGRNPTGRHFSRDAPREVEGVEHGWFTRHPGGIGMLENARFVIDGSPKNQHYPYHPEIGNVGWTEGWIQFNTAFNNSLAYLAHAETSIAAERAGTRLVVRLTAPLNFDYRAVEEGRVVVRAGGDEEVLVVAEDSANAWSFSGTMELREGTVIVGDGLLQAGDGAQVEVSYGYGYLARRASPGPAGPGEALDLGARVQPVAATARFSEPGYFVWCGAPVRGDDGRYHLYYSRWPVERGFHPGWAIHSEIAYAVSQRPLGPYRFVNVALPARGPNPATGAKYWDSDMTHNPNIVRWNGQYLLFYIGNQGDGAYATHRNHDRIGVAIAERPEGPWRRLDQPIIDVSPDPSAFDSLCVANPAAAVRPDGGLIVVYKAVARVPGKLMGGNVRYGVALADKAEGPYLKRPGRVFEKEGADASGHWMLAEDPYIWFSRKYGNCYYAVARDVVGEFTGTPGGLALFQSADGLRWEAARHPRVLGRQFAWADGSMSADKVERPALLLEGDEPIALFGATDGYQKSGRVAFNVQIPLKPMSP